MNPETVWHNVLDPLRVEFRTTLRILRETLACIPEDQWLTGRDKVNEPVRQVCHLIFWLGAYSGAPRTRIGRRFGVCVESFGRNVDPQKCPRPKDMLAWIDEVEKIALRHIDGAVEASIRGKTRQHPPLKRVLYVLRHTNAHLAYLIWELRSRGLKCKGF